MLNISMNTPILASFDDYASWSRNFVSYITTINPSLRIPLIEGYEQPKIHGAPKNVSRMSKEEKIEYELEKKVYSLLTSALDKDIRHRFKQYIKSKDLWCAIAKCCNVNVKKNDVDELRAETKKLNKRCEEIDGLREENEKLKKKIDELIMESELREKRTDDDKIQSVVQIEPCTTEEVKLISNPVECEKKKKRRRRSRRKSKKSTSRKKPTESVNLIDFLTKAFNDHMQMGVKKPPKVYKPNVNHSKHSFAVPERNEFRHFGFQKENVFRSSNHNNDFGRQSWSYHSYAKPFQQTRNHSMYISRYVERGRHHMKNYDLKDAERQSHENEIINLIPKPRMVWKKVEKAHTE